MNNSKVDELFRNWLALVEAMQSKDDDEVDRLTDEMIVVEHAILAGTAETDDDRRAQVAMLVHYAVNQPPYANYEVLEQWYRRLVIERLARCFAPHPGAGIEPQTGGSGEGAPFRGGARDDRRFHQRGIRGRYVDGRWSRRGAYLCRRDFHSGHRCAPR